MRSTLHAEDFVPHYAKVMRDDGVLPQEQALISQCVMQKCADTSTPLLKENRVPPMAIPQLVKTLHGSCSPGIDGVTAEHPKYVMGDPICSVLSHFLSFCLSFRIVPTMFQEGVIVPILKKSTLNPNDPCM